MAAPYVFSGDPGSEFRKYGVKKIPTYCDICFWKCSAWVQYDRKGSLWKITGNDKDPLCNGRLCPRGTAGLGMLRDEDRLKTPLIRTEKDGKQFYREASWPEALDYVALRTKNIIEEHGPESVALFNHGTSGKYFSRLLKALGSGNLPAPSYAQCRGPREVAFETTFGKQLGSPEPLDIKNTRCLVLIGSHLGENMHNSQVQDMSDLIDKKIPIITVDPRLSTAAAHSNYWLPIKPATDLALLLAWIHVLINDDIYDKAYVEKYCFGLEELRDHVKENTPEWAAKITNLKADDIRHTAWVMAEAAPSVIVHPGRHVTWYGDDTQRSRAIAILNALLGSYGRKGGFFVPAKARVPSFPHPPYPKPAWSWKDTCEGKYKLSSSPVSNALIEASHPDCTSDNKIKAWFISGTNLIETIPNQARTISALQNQELVVVIDTMPMEITGYADVVLPECTYLERYDDLRLSGYRNATVALRMPASKPKYLSKPASWMAKELAKRLGMGQYFKYDNYDEVLDYQLHAIGSSLREMRKKGILVFGRDESELFFKDDEYVEFNTPTGMIELFSFALEDEGFDPMPVFTQHPEPPEDFYRLNYGRAPMHTFAKTNNNPYLSDIMDENCIWVNPKVAKKWDLQDGQEVWLKNHQGKVSSFPGKIRLTERIGFDSIYMVHGFGHAEKRLSRSYAKGISDTELITDPAIDPIMAGTGMRNSFVTFVKEDPGKEVIS